MGSRCGERASALHNLASSKRKHAPPVIPSCASLAPLPTLMRWGGTESRAYTYWGNESPEGARAASSTRQPAVASTPAEPPHVLVVLPCLWAFSVVATGPRFHHNHHHGPRPRGTGARHAGVLPLLHKKDPRNSPVHQKESNEEKEK